MRIVGLEWSGCQGNWGMGRRVQKGRGNVAYTYVVSKQDSVEELKHAYHDEKGHEGIEE